jgi:hypothetical protein
MEAPSCINEGTEEVEKTTACMKGLETLLS